MKKLTTDELLTQMLEYCRNHFAEFSSEILIGDNAKDKPEFLITPIKPRKNEN